MSGLSALEKPPPSCVGWIDPAVSAGAALFAYILLRNLPVTNTVLALAVSLSVLAALAILEILRAPWRGSLPPRKSRRTILRRAAIKWAGTMAASGILLAGWCLLPEYRHPAYAPLFEAMPYVLPALPFVCGAWLWFSEWRLGPREDSAWHLGLLACGQWRRTDRVLVRDGLFGWLVRGFFLPLNFCALATMLGALRGVETDALRAPWPQAQSMLLLMISALIAAAITPGYFFSARLLQTDIRKVEHSWFGWAVTLACYPPLMGAVFANWLNFYGTGLDSSGMGAWVTLLQGSPPALYVAGFLVLALELVHYWGEAVFGLRASNLSNRGIITNGPYRFCKHPVYLAKCVSWLLVWMPFAAGSTLWDDLRLTLLWLGVCGIYLMRAWVEERLLSDDPVYVEYGLWMDRHGLLAPLGQKLPFLSFEWRLNRWRSRD